eukprot:TRINITY_DN76813_c0_g1_i1.p1 TRINITY_DN76813_c0_g1~~TRINITY_DN76813_c0_g1_i1.p1  ORF type:complete len:794 (+),score=167.12 TRINITY_DN76813_c0_g1_i1:93-2474(+)
MPFAMKRLQLLVLLLCRALSNDSRSLDAGMQEIQDESCILLQKRSKYSAAPALSVLNGSTSPGLSQVAGGTLLTTKVNVLAGTSSSQGFSRGNTLPIIARPFGFNHWAVQSRTNGGSWWFHPSDTNFYGIRCTHQPSPWIGDYGDFVIYPRLHSSTPEGFAKYSPQNSTFMPHLFGTSLQTPSKGEIFFEMTPSMHGAMIRLGFPQNQSGSLVLKVSPDSSYDWKVQDKRIIGVGRVTSQHGVRVNMFVVVEAEEHPGDTWEVHRDRAELKFTAHAEGRKPVVRLATSFISHEQASLSLRQELASKTFEALLHESQQEWHALLSRVRVEFTNTNRSEVFYTNLYRGLLFPRFLTELDADGQRIHYSAYTGKVQQGRAVTDEGFWDAYITHYPMLSLLYPDKLGEIIDGWVQAYEDRGWLPTWSSFTQQKCMVGTMGDCSLADAIVKSSQGFVVGFNRSKAFEAILKDAMVKPEMAAESSDLGRIALQDYIEKGYVPSDDNHVLQYAGDQSAALTLNYNLADACISYAADALGQQDLAQKLRNRSKSFKMLFDNSTKYFRPRSKDGSWARSEFDAQEWGFGFTEAAPAHYRFYTPHDVEGLTELMGGKEAFCEKISDMFKDRPRYRPGSYGQTIHEMEEATALGDHFGLYAHNNQPVHHVLYVAAAGGCRSFAQQKLREVMRELYTTGGWSGDEDTGEMSSWYILSALGLYSLVPGSDDFVIGSPEVTNAEMQIPGRPLLTIQAPGNSDDSVYVKGAELNGKAIHGAVVSYSQLASHGGKLLFSMASEAETNGV